MDYYSIDSEIIETLNILRPPVKRDPRFADDNLIGYLQSDSEAELVRDYSQQEQTNYYNLRRELKSSLSLILEKTSQRQIFEQYSLYSCQNNTINQAIDEVNGDPNKPTIKVTVIPKSERKTLLRQLKKHNRLTKTIHATCSNQENSIKSKNVFIVVAGPNKEKIYQLKASGSVKLTKNDFRADVDDLYYNKVYKAFKMESKIKKGPSQRRSPTEMSDVDLNSPRACCCCNNNNNGDTRMKDRKSGTSRVRLIGRLGVNESDNYVIKCDASINDKPGLYYPRVNPISSADSIKSNNLPSSDEVIKKYDKETMTIRPSSPQLYHCYDRIANLEKICRIIINDDQNKKRYKQNNYIDDYELDKTSNYQQQETQATQVNLYEQNIYTQDQGIQCTYKSMINSPTDNSSTGSLYHSSNESDPIVIISVYPNPDALITVTEPNVGMKKISLNRATLVEKAQSISEENIQKNRIRCRATKTHNISRSISPMKLEPEPRINENRGHIVAEARTVQYVRSRSPYGARLPKPNINSKPKYNEAAVPKRLNEKKSPSTFPTGKNQNKSTNKCNQSRLSHKVREQGINTDKIQTRNIAVDKLSKKTLKQSIKKHNNNMAAKNNSVNEKMCKEIKTPSPKKNVSKVLVNINSESEFYDVVFEQGKFKADLTVRKSTKEPVKRNDFACHKSESLKNFLPGETAATSGRDRRSASQVYHNNIDVLAGLTSTSRINVRDSIEIGHRREFKDHDNSIKDIQTTGGSMAIPTANDDANFSAPIKHYTGDDCVIYDPMLRDKEIRELLGIQRVNKNLHAMNTASFSGQEIIDSTQCPSILKGVTMNKTCTCVNCAKKNVVTIDGENENKGTGAKKNPKKISEVLDPKHVVINYVSNTNKIDLIDRVKNDIIVNENNCQTIKHGNSRGEKPTPNEKLTTHAHDSLLETTSSKQKSIHLSRKQYSKLKRSIRKLSEKRQKAKKYWRSSITSAADTVKSKSELVVHWDKEIQTDPVVLEIVACQPNILDTVQKQGSINENTIVIFSRDVGGDSARNIILKNDTRKTVSSVNIKRTNAGDVKHTTKSFTNICSLGSSTVERKKHNSIETLFRDQRKTHTPNLGTSALSLVTEGGRNKSVSRSDSVVPCNMKPKKPFLKRLMSCLVMRSARTSNPKIFDVPEVKCQAPSVNTSVDSYHISTSLAALEMTSSLYDTTASFYSTHTIGPHNHKIKRGFFNSVRGFLATRKI